MASMADLDDALESEKKIDPNELFELTEKLGEGLFCFVVVVVVLFVCFVLLFCLFVCLILYSVLFVLFCYYF